MYWPVVLRAAVKSGYLHDVDRAEQPIDVDRLARAVIAGHMSLRDLGTEQAIPQIKSSDDAGGTAVLGTLDRGPSMGNDILMGRNDLVKGGAGSNTHAVHSPARTARAQ